MLQELRVENLLLLERAELRLSPGLNVLTGETGAGKTLLAHALDLLLGGRARAGSVRGASPEAYVEGVFSLPERLPAGELIPSGAEEIVLARRVWADGRTRAYVCGRSATVADLRELGSQLLAFYGQHEHRKLMLSAAQLEILDRHCGPSQRALRSRIAARHREFRRLELLAEELRELADARERELDLLAFELDEIEALGPSEEEAERLRSERDRLRHVESIGGALASAAESIAPDGSSGATEALARAAQALRAVAGLGPELALLSERVEALGYEAEDLGGELRSYLERIEAAPGRLEEVEDRLAAYARLERKHGGSIAEVLRHAERCRRRRDQLEGAGVALEAAEAELAAAREELSRLADELRRSRRDTAPALAAAVRARLAELAMPEADFEVDVRPRMEGCGPQGADAVELMIAPNPGVPAAPLREIASGGELSRVMLALLSVAHGHAAEEDRDPLLVFDEIDAGIGGHTARAVGRHLRDLATARQILCITHLPQVAALAARHFTIAKDVNAVPARTVVTALEDEAIVGELVRMLGAAAGDRAASQHAQALMQAA